MIFRKMNHRGHNLKKKPIMYIFFYLNKIQVLIFIILDMNKFFGELKSINVMLHKYSVDLNRNVILGIKVNMVNVNKAKRACPF